MSHSMNNSCGLILDMRRHDDILVSVNCAVYNHAPYLRQCLDGFIMQKTDFCFEVIVHDDVSTDGSVEIIKEYADKYPDIIKPIYEIENQYSKHDGSVRRIMLNASSGKYIALCEGDDYWTDPYKLQKQVNYMEGHPECVLTHTGFSYFENGEITIAEKEGEKIKELSDAKIIFNILNGNNYRIQTCTAIYRLTTYYKILPQLKKINGLFLMGDTPLWVNLLQYGTIHYIDSPTSVYRIGNDSASHPKSLKSILRFNLSCAEMRVYYSSLCNSAEQDLFAKQLVKAYMKYKPFDYDYMPVVQIRLTPIVNFASCSKLILSIYKLYLYAIYYLRIARHRILDR